MEQARKHDVLAGVLQALEASLQSRDFLTGQFSAGDGRGRLVPHLVQSHTWGQGALAVVQKVCGFKYVLPTLRDAHLIVSDSRVACSC